jgi:single-strand DNA-binding protein
MLNCFLGIGRLGRDAELSTTRNGEAMARFSLAIDRIRRKGQSGDPDWVVCHLFGDRARILAPYLTKGSLIGVQGRLTSYRTAGDDSRQVLRIRVWEVNFLGQPRSFADTAAATNEPTS